MKKLLLALFLITNEFRASAEVPVIDFAAIAQAILQVMVASNQLAIVHQILDHAGDPLSVIISSMSQTASQLGRHGVGKSLPDIQMETTGQPGLSYEGNGLYSPVPSDIPVAGGQTIIRDPASYRKHEALQNTIRDYNDIISDTQTRRDALRDAQVQTLAQIKTATTDAEVQKLNAVQAAQASALSTVNAERVEAAAKVVIQKAANEADKARQEQADDETRAVSQQTALLQALKFFQADTKPLTLPNPKP